MKNGHCHRREFLHQIKFAAAAPLALSWGAISGAAELLASPGKGSSAARRAEARVAIVGCRSYGPEVRASLEKAFDLLGGIGGLVKNKTVTIKLNLTGTNFAPYLGRPVGETYMTHYATALALGRALFAAGAKRIRFVESTQSKATLAGTLALADWDVKQLESLGQVEFENTRNLGQGKTYAHLAVPGGGYMFSALELNQAYADTDVMVSLCKLKNHFTAGVTLSLKNLFGVTPNSLYGSAAGSEDATDGRGPLHDAKGFEHLKLPGLKAGPHPQDPSARVPRIVADVCAARPIHLSIIDGITAMNGAEGPWCEATEIKLTNPGIMIAGLNPVSTDAVGTAVMGYANPRATRGTKPFLTCDNHLLLAEEAGLGTAELGQIEVLGLPIEKARYPYG